MMKKMQSIQLLRDALTKRVIIFPIRSKRFYSNLFVTLKFSKNYRIGKTIVRNVMELILGVFQAFI